LQKNTVEAGGSVEESAEGLRSIAVIFPMMTFLMLTILMVQLQSIQKMLLEISVAPIDKGGRLAWSELPRDPNRQFFAVINVWLMSFSQPSPHASMGPRNPCGERQCQCLHCALASRPHGAHGRRAN
jgi:hypothetical protein